MSRWAPDAESRLHSAALALFVEQGFADTTVPQIASRAGLTTRSFFRYYSDKREVLFAGEDELPGVIERIFANAGPELGPLEVIRKGLVEAVAPRLERLREELLIRRSVVRSDEGLREREQRKLGIVHDAATAAFRLRGLSLLDAEIAGRLAVVIYDTALQLWLDEERPIDRIVDEVTASVLAMTRESVRPLSGSGNSDR
jgi:AcrR family transcriptional regulator